MSLRLRLKQKKLLQHI